MASVGVKRRKEKIIDRPLVGCCGDYLSFWGYPSYNLLPPKWKMAGRAIFRIEVDSVIDFQNVLVVQTKKCYLSKI